MHETLPETVWKRQLPYPSSDEQSGATSPAVLLNTLSLSLTLADLIQYDDITLNCGGKTIDANGRSRGGPIRPEGG